MNYAVATSGFPNQPHTQTADVADVEKGDIEKGEKISDTDSLEKAPAQPPVYVQRVQAEEERIAERREHSARMWAKARPFVLGGLILLILGWWISSIVLQDTRHRWIVQTLWAWFFIL